MIRPATLAARITLGVGAGVTLVWLASAIVAGITLNHEMRETFDSALQETAQRILPLAVRDIIDRDDDDDDPDQTIMQIHPHEEFYTYLVRDATGAVLLRSHQADEADFPPFEAVGFRRTDTHILYYDTALRGNVSIAIAEPLELRREALWSAISALLLPLIFLLPLGLIGVWAIIRHLMRPVSSFADEVSTRNARNLKPLSDQELPAEFTGVQQAVNTLMARLNDSLEAERSFAANAAHELRTPLAAALAQVQRLELETNEDATRTRAAEVATALKSLTHLAVKLMQLARAEGGRIRTDKAVDLRPYLALLVDDMKRQGIEVTLSLPDEAVLSTIDPDLFAIMTRNLLENATRHRIGPDPIDVTFGGDGALNVTNTCAPIAPEVLAKLSDRFERNRSAKPGSGLGLAIAQAIARGAGGGLRLEQDTSGTSNRFHVRTAFALE